MAPRPSTNVPADDLPRLWHFIVAYLLLSAGLYITIPLLLGVNSGQGASHAVHHCRRDLPGATGIHSCDGAIEGFRPNAALAAYPFGNPDSGRADAPHVRRLLLWIGAIISQYVAGGIGHIGLVVLATAVVVAPLSLVVLLCHGCISQDRFIVFGRMLACILVVGVIEGVFLPRSNPLLLYLAHLERGRHLALVLMATRQWDRRSEPFSLCSYWHGRWGR